MPNTEPPIDTVEQALEYRKEILSAVSSYASVLQNTSIDTAKFEPLMTFYLTKKLSPKDIEKGASGDVCKIYAVKSYPYGATTNSQWGYRNILEAKDVLREMENVGMPLLLHGEVHLNANDEEEDPYDGEKMFIADVLPRLLDKYPKLKVSLEHMSSAEAIFWYSPSENSLKLVDISFKFLLLVIHFALHNVVSCSHISAPAPILKISISLHLYAL